MNLRHILGIALLAFSSVVYAQSTSPTTKWHWDKGTIVVETPARPAGQQSALRLTAPKLETVRVGFAGLGSRGPWACLLLTSIVEKRATSRCASARTST